MASSRASRSRWSRAANRKSCQRSRRIFEKAGAGLQQVCDAAVKSASSAGGTKGVVEDIAKGAVGPLVDAIKSAAGALWTQHVEKDKLEVETIKTQLEAAKWPDF